MKNDGIAAELLESGDSLWSSVECELKHDRVIVYARLRPGPALDVEGALAASERVLASVLGSQDWLAAVQWSDRLCRTFTPARAKQIAAAENKVHLIVVPATQTTTR